MDHLILVQLQSRAECPHIKHRLPTSRSHPQKVCFQFLAVIGKPCFVLELIMGTLHHRGIYFDYNFTVTDHN